MDNEMRIYFFWFFVLINKAKCVCVFVCTKLPINRERGKFCADYAAA